VRFGFQELFGFSKGLKTPKKPEQSLRNPSNHAAGTEYPTMYYLIKYTLTSSKLIIVYLGFILSQTSFDFDQVRKPPTFRISN
jgi:hypothetical protein